MGVLHGRDLLSSKYITAVIIDKSKRVYFVPIKQTIDDYFLVNLNGQIYCFKIGQIYQYREKLTKQFQVLLYFTSHYLPINDKVEQLKMFMIENGLPKMNGMMSDVLRVLGNRERPNEEFKQHNLDSLVKELKDYEKKGISQIIPKNQNRWQKEGESIINFLTELDVKKIVTPVRPISEFIESDLKETDPKFPAVIVQTLQSLDLENKRVTNTPMHASRAWLLPMLIVMMIAAIGFFIYWAYDQGVFDDFLAIGDSFKNAAQLQTGINPNLGQSGSDPCSDLALQKKYPQPVDLKIAIANGSEPCKPSKFMQDILDSVDVP